VPLTPESDRPAEAAVAADYARHLFDLSGTKAVVTGGGSGLGEAIAIGLAQAGAAVSLIDINLVGARRVEAIVRDRGGAADAHEADVTRRVDLERVRDAVGRVDILVNSAGTFARFPAEDFPEDLYDRVLNLNLKGSFLSCQVFGRPMLEHGSGSIINLASIGASVAYPHATAYLQSKGGVAQMTRSLALEWIDRGVRVNAIAPSLFDTPLVQTTDRIVSPTNDFIMTRTPIGRRGRAYELVGPAIFLASAASAMVTGHILQVDGGYLAN
jgi:NAD(P)-dependent dehydrogenase (short-subunit alcohol dehydrogenase family)